MPSTKHYLWLQYPKGWYERNRNEQSTHTGHPDQVLSLLTFFTLMPW
jgi:hypothetical protein